MVEGWLKRGGELICAAGQPYFPGYIVENKVMKRSRKTSCSFCCLYSNS